MFKLLLMIFVISNSSISQAQSITVAGVPATVEKINLTISDDSLLNELEQVAGNFSYQITFGKLNESDFNRLKSFFRKENYEPIQYESDAEYDLVDFLPGKMQALMNKRLLLARRFSSELNDIDFFYKNSGEIFTTINCWGTAWEMVRDPTIKTPMNIFMSSRRHAQKVLEERGEVVSNQDDATFGDMILVLSEENGISKLQHAAVFLSSGFYFERTDSGSAMFFRIAHIDDMKERMTKVFDGARDFSGRAITIRTEHRHFPVGLPDPLDIFSAENTVDVGEKEYSDALPVSENKSKVTLFSDDRMGGGDEVTLQDTSELYFQLNSITGNYEEVSSINTLHLVGSD